MEIRKMCEAREMANIVDIDMSKAVDILTAATKRKLNAEKKYYVTLTNVIIDLDATPMERTEQFEEQMDGVEEELFLADRWFISACKRVIAMTDHKYTKHLVQRLIKLMLVSVKAIDDEDWYKDITTDMMDVLDYLGRC